MSLFRSRKNLQYERESNQFAELVEPHIPPFITFNPIGGGHILFSGPKGGRTCKSYQKTANARVVELADMLLALVADQGINDWPFPGAVHAEAVGSGDELQISYVREQGPSLELGAIKLR